MRKHFSVAVLLLACSALVSSHSNVRVVEDDIGFYDNVILEAAPVVAIFTIVKDQYDCALNDAVVPVVPLSPTVHDSFTPHEADGHMPLPLAMVRGPTA